MTRAVNYLVLFLTLLCMHAEVAAQKIIADAVPASLQSGQIFRDCPECPEMVVIPAGNFVMGSPENEAGKREESPMHRVIISKPFAISKYEVTWDEWTTCVQSGVCSSGRDEGFGRGRHPVINISRGEAIQYANWLSEKTGHQYRLPSEAEWEYAARGGTSGMYYWGDNDEITCEYASVFNAAFMPYNGKKWYWDSFKCNDGYKETAPTGLFKPNPFGLHDMLGNVREWTLDCFNGNYAGAPTDGSAWLEGECKYYVTRGGSWVTEPVYIRAASRYWVESSNRNDDLGIRLVRSFP
jgi:formylglycine-generating enzyme required for sulfatase activity